MPPPALRHLSHTETRSSDMAVLVEYIAPELDSAWRTRHTLGLVRHVSAPARSQLALSHSTVRHGQDSKSKTSLPSSPRHPRNASMPSSRLQSQCSVAQVIENQLLDNEQVLQVQQHATALPDQNCAIARDEHQASVAINNRLLDRLQMELVRQEKLVDQVKDLERGMARLKKSDRAKGKVWQRNLRLKATLQQYALQAEYSLPRFDTNTTALLQEALAIASERIEELGSKGEALLDALEESADSDGDLDEEEKEMKVLESAVAFRGTMEDETCEALKEHWCELLND
ncbi:hypothetical protein DE146DRAFT_454816 [Phaeosphaeria sp. MPI-PUGE-AT-0046c]|nr:hypothetical protein DE146DRAFT_454816 [Phaeosphaeria sp. MPI-PUGE-AT-0046c]